MRQVLQSLRTGEIEVMDIPAPVPGVGELAIRTSRSLISAGTERMLVEFGRANWLARARAQPDKVRQVLDKLRSDGLAATLEAVTSRLDQPLALGYSNVGVVVEIGAGVAGFRVGDRVVSNGKHAQIVCVPRNLCARVPEAVDDDAAAFAVVAAIGLQGIRLAEPSLGENVVVIGLGLIGLLTVQMLRAQGCRVLGVDPDGERLALAQALGAETVVNAAAGGRILEAAAAFSRGRGVDAVLISASTASNEPVSQAARMCRKRGRIVLVGTTGLNLSRADFYQKELRFSVSCSYGPGRYDPSYEQKGQDYPAGFVRWTEQRNFEAVLDLMASGMLRPQPLISRRFAIEAAAEAYDLLASPTPTLGILLEYPAPGGSGSGSTPSRTFPLSASASTAARVSVAVLGAGNHAGRVLIPALIAAEARPRVLVSASGVSAAMLGRKHGFERVSTDCDEPISDPEVNAVIIATRHHLHADQTLAAVRAGKSVYCEKPLCLTLEELNRIADFFRHYSERGRSTTGGMPILMVGFNRRFAPQVRTIRALLEQSAAPKAMVMTVNAGMLPADHWLVDRAVGGGRILGEACHFVDLLRYLAGAPIRRWQIQGVGAAQASGPGSESASLAIDFADGSSGSIHYLANGHRGFPKERLEVFCAGRILQLDNFRVLKAWGWEGFSGQRLWRQDKGQAACVEAFVAAVAKGGPAPIPLDEVIEVSRHTIEMQAVLDGVDQPC